MSWTIATEWSHPQWTTTSPLGRHSSNWPPDLLKATTVLKGASHISIGPPHLPWTNTYPMSHHISNEPHHFFNEPSHFQWTNAYPTIQHINNRPPHLVSTMNQHLSNEPTYLKLATTPTIDHYISNEPTQPKEQPYLRLYFYALILPHSRKIWIFKFFSSTFFLLLNLYFVP